MDPLLTIALMFLPVLAVQFRAFRLWDELVEAIWTDDRARWEALGRPIGFFWRPEEPKMGVLEGILPRHRLQMQVLGGLPDWAPEQGQIPLKMMGWRLTSILSVGGVALIGLFVLGWTSLR